MRKGLCISLGWLFRVAGSRFSARELWRFWQACDVVATKQMRPGGAGAAMRTASDSLSVFCFSCLGFQSLALLEATWEGA